MSEALFFLRLAAFVLRTEVPRITTFSMLEDQMKSYGSVGEKEKFKEPLLTVECCTRVNKIGKERGE